ncbi:MAG TPA: putative Ig domain-containing protein [Steroidobacteraceae bacterium]|nr:putative Ig domain-containing protein [Steroidobacteraceae bacterium]
MSPAWSMSWRSWRSHAALAISGTPASSVTSTDSYSFTPTTSGANSESLHFSITNKPAWATFNASNGTLSGTPSAANVGTDSNIEIVVSDRSSSASLEPFSIQVKQSSNGSTSSSVSTAPTISGTPPTSATVGQAYSFTPAAKGPTDTTLSFSVQNKPAWATFSIATGALTGTPAGANAGTDPGIVISVSDSSKSASLQPFSITVNAGTSSTGSASLKWAAPTTETDGAPLTNLAGFYIYDGTSPGDMRLIATVSSASTTTYTVSNLTSGTWYFAVTAFDSAGTQSALSNDVSKAF